MDEMKLLEAVGAIDDVVLKKALSYRPSTGSVDVVASSSPKEKEKTQNKKPKIAAFAVEAFNIAIF